MVRSLGIFVPPHVSQASYQESGNWRGTVRDILDMIALEKVPGTLRTVS